ncbi:ABC transporter permease [Chryseolinea lacunae]|uniref:ABC transporter permease n=1 Tax=Chryseolinea lacunae TaxID=2801331 RepID=A0ABS1KMR2_9BACT|nr:ABC transporter permease [Chryseolinea lacunae]MBL0740629.1 ABC transporter permease [Chryseolinea lacunae]
MTKKTEHPPKLFLKFFRWYCHPQMQDYIEGDLMEVYDARLKKLGKRKADLKFIVDVLLLFRPGIIKPAEGYKHSTPYGMYKSYFKIGWRNLIRNKAYSIINVAGLALSMTCGIFIFALVKHNLSFDNFHQNPERIYRVVTELHRDVIAYRNNVPSPLGEFFRNDYPYAEKVARVYTESGSLITLRKGNDLLKFKEDGNVSFAETTFFDIFNFPLLEGDKATALTAPNTAILTKRMAQKYFGDKSAVGETFWLENKIPCTVTGVLHDLPTNTDIRSEIFVSYATLKSYDPWLASATDGWNGIRDGMKCYVLLQPGASVAKVEEVMSAYVKIYRPTSKNVHRYKLQPLADVHFNAQYGGSMEKRSLWILSVIGLFLMATACVNFINLATAQALKRSKEVGVRKVLGSIKRQLFWQFIFETGMITFTGLIVAAMLAYIGFPYVNAFFKTQITINLFSDWTMALFIVGLGFVVTFLAGYYPGLVLSGVQPVAALKGKLSQQNIGDFNTRRTLIVAQFAISQVLIIGMVVIMNQMRFAKQSDLGFDKEAIVMINAGRDSTGTVANTMKNEISRLPGVEKISLCFAAPSSEHDWGNSIRIDNNTEEVNFRTSIKSADADYVSTFDLELVAGRNLVTSDTVREMLVNEAMVRKLNLKSPEDAIGHIIVANGGSMKAPIVGVLRDFHDKSFHEEINPILVTTYRDDYSNYAVKLNMTQAKSTLTAIEKLWTQQHPDQLFEYAFVDESIAQFYANEEATLKLIQIFCFIAIFIGCLGLYGLVSFMASQKTKEIGIRKVLGGSVAHIAWLFGKEFARLIVIAFALAAPIGWWLMHNWLQGFEFQISINAWTFVLAIGCSLFVATLTVGYQVLKTAFVNPAKSLRIE